MERTLMPTKRPPMERFEQKYIPEPNSGCWIWTASLAYAGYGRFMGNKDFLGQTLAHRIAWILFNGPVPDGLEVCHRCDVPCCVNPQHLFLGTHDQNMKDMAKKGRRMGVFAFWNRKIDLQQMAEIRTQYQDGLTQQAIALMHRVSPATISRVIRRDGPYMRSVNP